MNPLPKVTLAVVLVTLILYLGIDKFLGDTQELTDSMDVRALTYIRPEPVKEPEPEVVVLAPDRAPTVIAPERDLTGRIDAKTVLPEVEEVAATELSEESENDEDSAEVDGVDEDKQPKSAGQLAEEAEALALSELTPESEVVGEVDHDLMVSNKEDEEDNEQAGQDTELVDSPAVRQKQLLEKLGVREPKPATRAVDVRLETPENCDISGVALAPVSVQYRFESHMMRGVRMAELEILVSEYRRCDGGVFHFTRNSLGKVDSTPLLAQMRLDELKYFFVQHSVPKTALRYPEDQ